MKYAILPLFLLPLISTAQFSKGDITIGGSFGVSSQARTLDSEIDYENKSFSVSPIMNFFVKENLSVGFQIGYSSYSYKYTYSPPLTNKYYSGGFYTGLMLRRYFTISEKFLFFVSGHLDYSRGTTIMTNDQSENKSKNYQLGVSVNPRFIFFPSPKWGFEAGLGSLGYSYSEDLSSDTGSHNFNINYGTVTLGVSYYFRGLKQ